MLRESILEQLQASAPDWDLSLDDAQFDWKNRSEVVVTQLRLTPPGEKEVLVSIPRLTLSLDGELLQENMQVLVRKITLHDPHLNLIRAR